LTEPFDRHVGFRRNDCDHPCVLEQRDVGFDWGVPDSLEERPDTAGGGDLSVEGTDFVGQRLAECCERKLVFVLFEEAAHLKGADGSVDSGSRHPEGVHDLCASPRIVVKYQKNIRYLDRLER
jgi:hypothetical protein